MFKRTNDVADKLGGDRIQVLRAARHHLALVIPDIRVPLHVIAPSWTLVLASFFESVERQLGSSLGERMRVRLGAALYLFPNAVSVTTDNSERANRQSVEQVDPRVPELGVGEEV